MGGTGVRGQVIDGAFANWPIVGKLNLSQYSKYLKNVTGAHSTFTGSDGWERGNSPFNPNRNPVLTRFGNGFNESEHDFEVCANMKSCWSEWFGCIEDGGVHCKGTSCNFTVTEVGLPGGPLHGGAHWGIGGTNAVGATAQEPTASIEGQYMGDFWDLATSPNDPIFMFHHSNVERSRMKWMKANAEKKGMYYGFPLLDKQCLWGDSCTSNGTSLYDTVSALWPFDGALVGSSEYVTHADVMCKLSYDNTPYTYDDMPEASSVVRDIEVPRPSRLRR